MSAAPRSERYQSFAGFYPFYIGEHQNPICRRLHIVGTGLSIVMLGAGALVDPWFFLLAPLVGYLFAWIGHFFF